MTDQTPKGLPNPMPLRPTVKITWEGDAPCIDLACVCGQARHVCDGPQWFEDGKGLEVPGIQCEKCYRRWSLYEFVVTTELGDLSETRWSLAGRKET